MIIGAIRFAGDLPPWVAATIAIAAALGVVLLYLRETRSLAMPYCYLLPALRASAVALVILILAGPVWHRRQVIGTLGRVVFAVDTSDSMSVSDSATSESTPIRLERALRLITGDQQNVGWIESLSGTHTVDVIAFSSGDPAMIWSSRQGDPPPAAFELSADGQRTDLASPLSTMLASLLPGELMGDPEREADPQRAAIVLLSDGRDNIGGSPVDIAERLKSAGVRVHAIGMGSEDEPTDASVVSVQRPQSVASDGQLSGSVVVNHDGMDGQTLTVRIESAGQTLWQQTLTAGATRQQTVSFQLDVAPIIDQIVIDLPRGIERSTVVMDLLAVIDPVDGDSNANNNSFPFRVAASTRDRRLLVLDGSSRWETRYVRNLFQRDPAWSVDTVIYGPGTDIPKVIRGDKPGQFPDAREVMAAYDAIILGEVPPEQFSQEDASQLREFVSHGGGLIAIDGRYDRLRKIAQDSLPQLIPVDYADRQLPMQVQEIQPSPMGMKHPLLNLSGDPDQLAEFWKHLPAPKISLSVTAQEGSEVLADMVAGDGRRSPWLVTRMYGAGRVFYLSSDQTWRWRYKVADRFHARFWNQLLAAAMQPPYSASDDHVALGTDKIEYTSGESSIVRVRLQDTQGKPVGDATVDALLVADDHVIATVPLSIDDPARGTYRGQTPPLERGAYEVRIRASGFDSAALQATTPIWVSRRDSTETRRVSLDSNALTQLAETSGGLYFHESSADAILDSLRPLSSGTVVESDILVWQSFYWFWIVITLLAIEWWMRKQGGLV